MKKLSQIIQVVKFLLKKLNKLTLIWILFSMIFSQKVIKKSKKIANYQ